MKLRVSFGRIGFLLAGAPWLMVLGHALGLYTNPQWDNWLALLIMAAPCALLAGVLGLILDRPRNGRFAATIIACFNLLLMPAAGPVGAFPGYMASLLTSPSVQWQKGGMARIARATGPG